MVCVVVIVMYLCVVKNEVQNTTIGGEKRYVVVFG